MRHCILLHGVCVVVGQVSDDMVKRVREENYTIITQEIFVHDPSLRIQNLKAGLCNLNAFVQICQRSRTCTKYYCFPNTPKHP